MNTKRAETHYQGHLIRKTEFGRYTIPSMPWGDQPGEVPSFRTLGLAKDFIDRNADGVTA